MVLLLEVEELLMLSVLILPMLKEDFSAKKEICRLR